MGAPPAPQRGRGRDSLRPDLPGRPVRALTDLAGVADFPRRLEVFRPLKQMARSRKKPPMADADFQYFRVSVVAGLSRPPSPHPSPRGGEGDDSALSPRYSERPRVFPPLSAWGEGARRVGEGDDSALSRRFSERPRVFRPLPTWGEGARRAGEGVLTSAPKAPTVGRLAALIRLRHNEG